jgi:hypothetical protein
MTIEEACRLWVERDFSSIPISIILKAYKDDPEELELLSSEYPVYAYPAAHGWMFFPENSIDRQWMEDNIDIVEKCGFIAYQSEDFDILLGIDGGGYCFYTDHWIPLYEARKLQWHDSNNED